MLNPLAVTLASLRTLKISCTLIGVYTGIRWLNEFGHWARSFFPENGTAEKAGEVGEEALRNGTVIPEHLEIEGLWSAFWSCPLPLSQKGYRCYLAGWNRNPVGQAAATIWEPVRFFGSAAYCFAQKTGAMNKAACAMGLDDDAKKALEEKVQVAACFIFLMFAVYVTRHKDESKKTNEAHRQ